MLLAFCYFVFVMLGAVGPSNKIVGRVQKGSDSAARLEKMGC